MELYILWESIGGCGFGFKAHSLYVCNLSMLRKKKNCQFLLTDVKYLINGFKGVVLGLSFVVVWGNRFFLG
jgi:hypothetical protein